MKTVRGSAVIRGAAEILRKDGWCQGQAVDDYGRKCSIGALIYSIEPRGRYVGGAEAEEMAAKLASTVAIAAAGYALNNERFDGWLQLVGWNNDAKRQAAEVIAAFDEAARIAESAEMTDQHWPEVQP